MFLGGRGYLWFWEVWVPPPPPPLPQGFGSGAVLVVPCGTVGPGWGVSIRQILL